MVEAVVLATFAVWGFPAAILASFAINLDAPPPTPTRKLSVRQLRRKGLVIAIFWPIFVLLSWAMGEDDEEEPREPPDGGKAA